MFSSTTQTGNGTEWHACFLFHCNDEEQLVIFNNIRDNFGHHCRELLEDVLPEKELNEVLSGSKIIKIGNEVHRGFTIDHLEANNVTVLDVVKMAGCTEEQNWIHLRISIEQSNEKKKRLAKKLQGNSNLF